MTKPISSSGEDQGFVLVAALLLVVVVGIVAATVLQTTSTEIKISGNQRQAVQDFYSAEAGLAEAQARLRLKPGSVSHVLFDQNQINNPLWSAYILTSSIWSPKVDPDFSPQFQNRIPLKANPINTSIQVNSVQSDLSYWVKVRHKTEYDAEKRGHRKNTPHYLDQDGRTSKHRSSNLGNIIFYGFPSPAENQPRAFTTLGASPWFPVELVTSHGGSVVLEAELVHPTGPNHLGALYAVGDITLSGQSRSLNGHDACGIAPSVSPAYSGGTVTGQAGLGFEGASAIPMENGVILELAHSIEELSKVAKPIQSDLVNQNLGTSEFETYVVRVSDLPNPRRLLIRNVGGKGILLIDGKVVLEGEISWNGMLIVTGDLIMENSGANMRVIGGVWAGAVQQMAGDLTIHYDSCQIRSSLLSQPVRLKTWREVF